MDQYTKNLEISNKYRVSHLQSYLCQNEKNKVIEEHNSKISKTWFLPVASSLSAIFALRSNQPRLFSQCCVATFFLVTGGLIFDFKNNESLEKNLNVLNRSLPNPVQLQEEYARDLEIFRRNAKN